MDTQTLVLIGLAVLLLASFVVAYLSSRTWHVGQVVLVFFLLLANEFFFYLAAKTLKVHQTYRSQVVTFEKQQADLESKNFELANGSETDDGSSLRVGGIRQLRQDLHKLTFDRGRVWRNCTIAEPADEDGTTQITVESPAPHGIRTGTILFVFEEGAVGDGARYLGEFKVTEAADDAPAVTIASSMPLTDEALKRVVNSKASWSLYEVMPADRHDLFLAIEEAQLRAVLPPESIEEYLKDGKEAALDEPEERVLGRKADGSWVSLEVLRDENALGDVVERQYVRQLRDYQYLFRELERQRAVDHNAIAQMEGDATLLQEALAKAKQDVAYREEESVKLAADLKRFRFEQGVAGKHLRALQAQYTNVQQALDSTLEHNEQLAAELAQFQRSSGRPTEPVIEAIDPFELTPLDLERPFP